MNIFKGQTKNAEFVREIRKQIPEKLKCYIDFRAKASGITLVSLFEFSPMRGIDVRKDQAMGFLDKLKKKQDFLISPKKSDEEKRKFLKEMGFKKRKTGRAEYQEEDVQAFLIQELLGSEAGSISKKIMKKCNFNKLKYITSELEWRYKNKTERVDVLCCDGKDPNKVLIIELKKVRTTKLTQAKYLTSLKENGSGLKQFISSVTGTCKIGDKNLQMQMIYLMPHHPRLVKDDWNEIAKNNGIHGIIFYKRGYVAV